MFIISDVRLLLLSMHEKFGDDAIDRICYSIRQKLNESIPSFQGTNVDEH